MRLNGMMPVVATSRASTEGVMLETIASISLTVQPRLMTTVTAARRDFTVLGR